LWLEAKLSAQEVTNIKLEQILKSTGENFQNFQIFKFSNFQIF
jgi:hypothetical protein